MSSKKNKKNKAQSRKSTKSNKSVSSIQKLTNSAKEYWTQKSPVLKFLLGFAGCMFLFYVIYYSDFFLEYIGNPLIRGEAKVGSFLLNLLGQETTTVEELIQSDVFSISVKKGCDGLEPLAILLSGILVFPVKFEYKIPGIVWGIVAVMLLNFVRITGLYLVGLYFPGAVFDILHEQGGFIIFTALSIFIWMFWANRALIKNHDLNLKSATT
ncbi:MAG: exosortase/archaeosortase family protein [Bacteroidetes bacterium]|jgi:exosortase/archaeosortase family protein|nr:exosortase/archaeosortase family protein [Bacteroidota bacterium]MDF1865943.1 archaeosortase/exosortase family protein [Saprospiraceae bacterium]